MRYKRKRYVKIKFLDCNHETLRLPRNIYKDTKKVKCLECDKLIGLKKGKLLVLNKLSGTAKNRVLYICKCDCGNTVFRTDISLKNNCLSNCGCETYAKTKKFIADRRDLIKYVNPYILNRDSYTCYKCNISSYELDVHHIFDFAHYKELQSNTYNLITLCKNCHRANKNYPNSFHSIYPSTKSNTLTDLENWLGFKYKYRDDLLKEYNKYYRSLKKQGLYEELLAQ